ncbi:DNA mismatch repair protein Msh6 [Basidiobolus meristosporus CBS 931.73]|uniref:DNA mismatch repair protein MSH6 n=1 Tax=Basidiobolus meristosporus CBS 931.73 TaxID=1314790 RepID=A0A1Y1YYB2_9FUNG|nr:DNA mismatch repair protein Msh6 [Basidiobolus meristosporus CBS 931.73]|eukprot:ORY03012.1 DNA mismatch repair protein Msh6 [Basidiobolus meristosporus CBS 931.73]
MRNDKKKEKNETRYSWLVDVRDANGKSVGDPDYDPRTLKIPSSAWNLFTPFEKQFWEIKASHFDTVVFFKKGKFYELYEKDADIGHQEFDLKMTDRVNMRMVGVPESSFDHWASQFIAKGYKVAKVEQMETAIGKSMRERSSQKKEEKIIRRELTSILTVGTLVDSGLLHNEMSTYCMAIKEECAGDNALPSLGICFVDTATAAFYICCFEDDLERTRFETLILQIKPKEVILEKNGISQRTLKVLKNSVNAPVWNYLTPETEFWDSVTTLDALRRGGYFDQAGEGNEQSTGPDGGKWPAALVAFQDKHLALSALGGLTWYLRSLKLDKELLSLKNIHAYDPIHQMTSLILDGQTLVNLEIFENSFDGGEEGTVFKLLNRCSTPFGKRLFKKWLCHPLRSAEQINERLDAIENINADFELQDELSVIFTSLPDLERIISRIHAGTCKLKELLNVLRSFEAIGEVMNKMKKKSSTFTSKRLVFLLNSYPDLTDTIKYFNEAFDHEKAEKEGTVVPHLGVEDDYDAVVKQLQDIEDQFAFHLKDCRKKLNSSKIEYKDLGKEIYQIEVPKNIKVPDNWIKLSQTKAVNRYWNMTTKSLVQSLNEAQETRSNILSNIQSRMYQKFDANYPQWSKAVSVISELDCLFSLAKSSISLGEPYTRPEFVEGPESVLEFEELRHPCVVPGVATDFIPNDTYLGGQKPNIILLTGPNMGGKSTLLRQTCVAIIMAQLGCYVPARRCRMTTFDRIFTRIGANDNILAGQSTFMVELSETSKILREATPRSMVILDELGRGTSTFDGYAIAYSVLHYLSTYVGCLGLFSTHYGMLTTEMEKTKNIALMHMSCQVDEERKEVTFLYKLTEGSCPKSYGMNVANMAGVPRAIVDKAEEAAKKFEANQHMKQAITSIQNETALAAQSDFAFLWKLGSVDNPRTQNALQSIAKQWSK